MEAQENKNVELARKALLMGVKDETFNCEAGSYSSGTCGDGYVTESTIEITKDQLMYLLYNAVQHKEVFHDIAMLPFDMSDELENLGYECSWPDGGAHCIVTDAIPEELKDLAEQLDEFDEDNEEELSDVREQLNNVSSGIYTFRGDVMANSGYMFEEDTELEVRLTADEALGLLYGYSENLEAFRGICRRKLDENFVMDKLDDSGEADQHDHFDYSGSCDEFDIYAKAWDTLICKILDGKITEDELPGWVDYFSDLENLRDENDIESWYEETHGN